MKLSVHFLVFISFFFLFFGPSSTLEAESEGQVESGQSSQTLDGNKNNSQLSASGPALSGGRRHHHHHHHHSRHHPKNKDSNDRRRDYRARRRHYRRHHQNDDDYDYESYRKHHHHRYPHRRDDDDDDDDDNDILDDYEYVQDLLQPPYCYTDADCRSAFERPSEAICELKPNGNPPSEEDGDLPSICGCAYRKRIDLNGAGPGLHRCETWACTEDEDCQFSRHAPWLKDELGLDSGLGCYHELGNYYAETCGCSLADKAGRYGCPDQSALAADKKKKGGGKKKMKKNGEKKG